MANAHGITDLEISDSNGRRDSRGTRRRNRQPAVSPQDERPVLSQGWSCSKSRVLLTTYTVTSTGTTNVAGTLLYAINQLDSGGGSSNIINFNIPGSGVQTISPASPACPRLQSRSPSRGLPV